MIFKTSVANLQSTVKILMTPGRGILAADESETTIAKRFEGLAIACTEENRRRYRQLLITAPTLNHFISGVILFDETIRQRSDDGRLFGTVVTELGIVPGIKVDLGAKPLAGSLDERITEGLDGLRERLQEYRSLGARFAKWRAVITIGEKIPTAYCLEANAHALARYAALCQEAELVPIVEPEVLMDGAHSLERAFEVTQATLESVFAALRSQRVVLEHMLLKPNMVLAGADSPQRPGVQDVAEATVRCLRRTVPPAVPGIVFLSGGQAPQLATAHLNAMNLLNERLSWPLSFSFARALQEPALEKWRGDPNNVTAAQQLFLHRARCNSAASEGRYTTALENEPSVQSVSAVK